MALQLISATVLSSCLSCNKYKESVFYVKERRKYSVLICIKLSAVHLTRDQILSMFIAVPFLGMGVVFDFLVLAFCINSISVCVDVP